MIIKYILPWFGMMVLAVINGTIRDFTYKPYTGALTAHQISTLTLILIFAAYFWFLEKKMPSESARQAWMKGIVWLIMTEIFEFGLGIRRGMSWSELLYTYNLFEGQVWIFIPLWVLTGPYVFYRTLARKS